MEDSGGGTRIAQPAHMQTLALDPRPTRRRSAFRSSSRVHVEARDVTFLFSDVEGFTELIQRLGDRRAYRTMARHDAIVRAQLDRLGGEAIELRGDGVLIAFRSPLAGLRCATGIQQALALDRIRHPREPVHVRMGLHRGDALRGEGSYFGQALILCARISEAARGGEILLSEAAARALTDCPERSELVERHIALKGFAAEQRVFSLRPACARRDESLAQSEPGSIACFSSRV